MNATVMMEQLTIVSCTGYSRTARVQTISYSNNPRDTCMLSCKQKPQNIANPFMYVVAVTSACGS